MAARASVGTWVTLPPEGSVVPSPLSMTAGTSATIGVLTIGRSPHIMKSRLWRGCRRIRMHRPPLEAPTLGCLHEQVLVHAGHDARRRLHANVQQREIDRTLGAVRRALNQQVRIPVAEMSRIPSFTPVTDELDQCIV